MIVQDESASKILKMRLFTFQNKYTKNTLKHFLYTYLCNAIPATGGQYRFFFILLMQAQQTT